MLKPRQVRFNAAKSDILRLFRENPQRVFSLSHLKAILEEKRAFWRLTKSTTFEDFLEFLIDKGSLKEVRVRFPNRPMIRYTWGDAPMYEVLLSWHPASYLSHYTAVYLHDLTEQIPKAIYLNAEQVRKARSASGLSQHSIDTAFKRPMRRSKTVAQFRDFDVCLLNSMGTGNLGVVESTGPEGEWIRVTNVERTLIDITVRPGYAGGVFEVLKAFRNAKGKFSINSLTAMLKTLDYVYPYHQAVGFYLDRAGVYDESAIQLLRRFGMEYDFYLTYDMRDPDYSKEWRLFIPKGL